MGGCGFCCGVGIGDIHCKCNRSSGGDVAVIGSPGVAQHLAASGLVDEYRLLVVPDVVDAAGNRRTTTSAVRLVAPARR